jgi:hypothetical protein
MKEEGRKRRIKRGELMEGSEGRKEIDRRVIEERRERDSLRDKMRNRGGRERMEGGWEKRMKVKGRGGEGGRDGMLGGEGGR